MGNGEWEIENGKWEIEKALFIMGCSKSGSVVCFVNNYPLDCDLSGG